MGDTSSLEFKPASPAQQQPFPAAVCVKSWACGGGTKPSPGISSTDYYRRKFFSLSTIFFSFFHLFSVPPEKTQHLVFILLPAPLLEKITHTIKIKNTPENQGERLAAGWFFCYNDDDELRPFFDCVRKTNTKWVPCPVRAGRDPIFFFPAFFLRARPCISELPLSRPRRSCSRRFFHESCR